MAKACVSEAEASALISNLKKKGIDAFVVPNAHDSTIWVALGVYATDAEAEAANRVFEKKGVDKPFIYELRRKK